MSMIRIGVSAIALVLLAGCTTTQQGKDIDKANYADIASTAFALATGTGVEANPLGLTLIPLKMGMGYLAEKQLGDDCISLSEIANVSESFFYGAAVNNVLIGVGAGSPAAPILGLAYGIYRWRNPTQYDCNTE
jgi:hypothetical protein